MADVVGKVTRRCRQAAEAAAVEDGPGLEHPHPIALAKTLGGCALALLDR